MSRFFDVLYPRLPEAGRLQSLVLPSSYPDADTSRGLLILRNWMQDIIYGLRPSHNNPTLDMSNANTVLELFLLASGWY